MSAFPSQLRPDVPTTSAPHYPSTSLKAQLAVKYPGLVPYLNNFTFVHSTPDNTDRELEYYGKGEGDSPNPGMPTIQLFGGQRLRDVAGEIVSHNLARGNDQRLTGLYNHFVRSLNNPAQIQRLHEQYQWAQKNEGEARPYAQWANISGIPAYFRGYTFNQWPSSVSSSFYTPKQISLLNQVRSYIGG